MTTSCKNANFPCVGALDRKISILDRNLQSAAFNSPTAIDFDENFSNSRDFRAAVRTVAGKTLFDGVDTLRNVSHEFTIRYVSGITSSAWIHYNGDRYDILNVQNIDERFKFLKLMAVFRGPITTEASKT